MFVSKDIYNPSDLVPCISITTANLFALSFNGVANSNVWYPASKVSELPAAKGISCKSALFKLSPLGLTYTLHVHVSAMFIPTSCKYSVSLEFLVNFSPK